MSIGKKKLVGLPQVAVYTEEMTHIRGGPSPAILLGVTNLTLKLLFPTLNEIALPAPVDKEGKYGLEGLV